MQRITYASGAVLTGDRLADAIATYARALALNDKSDLVSFPIVLDSGTTASAKVLIGPASQLMMVPELSPFEDPDDDDVLADISQRTAALGMSRPVVEEDDELGDAYPDEF